MLLHALIACLLGPQATQDHSALHGTANAGYIEMSDVQRLLDACEQSSAANFIRDPDLAPFWKQTLSASPVPAGGLRQTLLELAISDAEQRARLEPMVASLRALSLSFDLDREGLEELARAGQEGVRVLEQLSDLRRQIDAHARAHEGVYPASLDELTELEAEQRSDPWGNAFVYTRSEDGTEAELKSLGSDGVPGGEAWAADWTPESSLLKRSSELSSKRASGTIALEFSDAAIAASAADAWRSYRAGLSEAEARGMPNACAEADRFMLLGMGEISETALNLRLANRAGSRPANGSPLARLASLGARTPSTVLQLGMALTPTDLRALAPTLPEAIARAIAPMGAWRVHFENGQFDTISRTDSSGWLGSCLRERGELSLGDAEQRAPAGALFSLVAALDLQRVAREVGEQLKSLASDTENASASAPAASDASSITSAVERLAAHTSGPVHLWVGNWDVIGAPPTYIVLELSDPVRFTEELLELPRALPEEFIEKHPLRVRPYLKTPITTWNVPGTQAGMFEPSWCVLGNEFLLSTSRTSLVNEIKRRRNLAPPAASDSLQRAATGDAVLAWRFDFGALGENLLAMGRGASRMLGDMLPVEALPKAGVFKRHFRTLTSTTRREGGELLTRRSADLLVDMSLVRLLLRLGPSKTETGEPADAVVPDSGQSNADAALASTKTGLLRLENALVVYMMENGGYPERLEKLLEPTTDFPSGYLDAARELPRDAQQQAFVYQRSATGYRLWSIGANGRDEAGAGDDVLVERNKP